MCGIFGIVARESETFSPETFQKSLRGLLRLSQSRGSEATGVALAHSDNIRVLKSPISAEKFIHTRSFGELTKSYLSERRAGTPFVAIGHSRMVTNGSRGDNVNNQPVVTDEVVGIHNGIVVNTDALAEKHRDLPKNFELDSVLIFSLLQEWLRKDRSIPVAVKDTFEELQGAASVASVFTNYNCVLIATNHGSLYTCESQDKNIVIFASELLILRKLLAEHPQLSSSLRADAIKQLRPNSAAIIDFEGPRAQLFSLAEPRDDFAVSNGTQRKIVEHNSDTKAKLAPGDKKNSSDSEKERIDRLYKRFPHDPSFANSLRRCTKCLLPETMTFIKFDEDGVCNYCQHYQPLKHYGVDALQQIADKIRSADGSADCVVGLSGGRDSCYGLHYIVRELGLNPVAFTYDWGMVTDLARRNISRMCGKLGVEHILVSANIPRKRDFVRMNVKAWLRRPALGVIPLFMAGDKEYFYHANRLKRELGLPQIFLCENMLERTDFKIGFAGLPPSHIDPDRHWTLSRFAQVQILSYYLKEYLLNPSYFNASLLDTFKAYIYYYVQKKDYANLFRYVRWDESEVVDTLRNEYDWELAPDTDSTWRIGDGTASLYNYIYYRVCGFTENDTFRSNQIREGVISREEALKLSEKENRPRFHSLKQYCDLIGLEAEDVVERINQIPHLTLDTSSP